MRRRDDPESFVAACRAIVRSDERAILFFLLIVSILGLIVLLYYRPWCWRRCPT